MSVDALRGIAAVAVVAYHARGILWTGTGNLLSKYGFNAPIDIWIGYLTYPLSFGWIGVTLFFCLSGYCIHRRNAVELSTNPDAVLNLKTFFSRRIRRIYPTYFAALIFSGLVDYYLFHFASNNEHSENLNPEAFFSTLLTVNGYLAPNFGTNTVFWTLAMEMHLYFAYPLLYYISKHFGGQRVLLVTGLASGVFSILDAIFGIQAFFPYRFTRGPIFLPYWFTWAVGFYLAEVQAKRATLPSEGVLRLLTIVALVAGVTLVGLGFLEQAEVAWAIVAGAILRWSLSRNYNELTAKLLNSMAFLGIFSFSLYAIHRPVLYFFRYLIMRGQEKTDSIGLVFLGIIVCVAFAYAFFLIFEKSSLIYPQREAKVS